MKRFIYCLVFLLCVIFYPSVSAAQSLFQTEKNFYSITPERAFNFLTSDFYKLASDALNNPNTAAMEQMRDMALQGDFAALTALAIVTRLRKDQAEVLPNIYEEWMYRELGEQESGYQLSALAAAISRRLNMSKESTSPLERMVVEHLRRAAKAGHAEAMYGLTLYTDRFPDPDFRMPDKPDFPIATQAIADKSFTPEQLYWLGKAAASGSYRANLLMGSYFIYPKTPHARDTHTGLELMKKAISQGSTVGASKLEDYLNPNRMDFILPEATCHLALYYATLLERMEDDNGLVKSEKSGGSAHPGSPTRKWMQCVSETDYFAILAQSRVEYSAIRAKLLARKQELAMLYARAKAHLPELREAYQKTVTQPESEDRKGEGKVHSPEPNGREWGAEQCSLSSGAQL